ncbi:MAG: hypothetical protein ACXWID_10990 [Pyrinomonadaceae bacterium]
MLKKLCSLLLAFLFCGFACLPAHAQNASNNLAHLTVYNANMAEFLDERMIELQPGRNTIMWRSLMPRASIRTVRVIAQDAEVLRQDVTYDGPQVNNEKSPVLHLVIQNRGPAARKRVQVDYLAPNISWQADYLLVLEPTAKDAPPTAAMLDSWVSLNNNTGVDIDAGTIDLVAGEISLLSDGSSDGYRREYTSQAQSNISGTNEDTTSGTSFADVSSLSAFNRFTLGNNISLNANATISRFPIFQRARLAVVQRNIFENTYDAQTLGRGGFILLPRGLEVRLVLKNAAGAPMPAGLVTMYQREGAISQIVGQDRIGFVPPNGEFSLSQGRSTTIFGTRRILERRVVDKRVGNENDNKLVTKVEIVLMNRGSAPVEAFVREGIERYDDNEWKIIESTVPAEPLGANTVQFKATVPAGGKVTITYTVESD